MEADLDTLLDSHFSDSDDDSNSIVPHRTIDEILNDSDASTSSSSPSSPLSSYQRSDNRLARSNTVPQEFVELLEERDALSEGPAESSKTSPFKRIGDPVWRVSSSSSSKQLPTLFGGVKSNAKPGAALAAAAAASRSVPTPHAAAIKSRRAVSGGVLQRVVGSDDQDVSSVNGESIGVSSKSSVSGEKLEIDDYTSDNKMGDFQSADTHQNSEANNEIDPVSVSENSLVLDANDSYEKSVLSLPSVDQERNISKDLERVGLERENVASDMPSYEDGEENASGGDDKSSMSDISELVEERLEQLESEMMSKRVESNARATMKPLELAEELEKKQASTGLHWEEGAAAQPMRLEGVRRGSTTLGYFDVDASNIITRTLSSQAFRRDHGSPQVLAVHLNFIAVGMTKGVIILVPSKYTTHHADSMDPKVL
ncbi:hypothetical protein E1A91_A12G126100v1 [Gossypium mustelinum]|uniref:Vacuolar protein sorting-associated protein 8 central domain-containing protein n=1 Tax=Gossypium mustelinum TaxID=34275 RepID=A0A5D2WTN5_GOSMU|nr:hypothetical protein E1A91_A12G126100v1 [Gossypium mustelinum]